MFYKNYIYYRVTFYAEQGLGYVTFQSSGPMTDPLHSDRAILTRNCSKKFFCLK